jgi:hypothetical protein
MWDGASATPPPHVRREPTLTARVVGLTLSMVTSKHVEPILFTKHVFGDGGHSVQLDGPDCCSRQWAQPCGFLNNVFGSLPAATEKSQRSLNFRVLPIVYGTEIADVRLIKSGK